MTVKQGTGLGKQRRGFAVIERPLDQLVGTVADPGAHQRLVGLGQLQVGQSTVDRQCQLGGTVDKGAIQIEQHQIKFTINDGHQQAPHASDR